MTKSIGFIESCLNICGEGELVNSDAESNHSTSNAGKTPSKCRSRYDSGTKSATLCLKHCIVLQFKSSSSTKSQTRKGKFVRRDSYSYDGDEYDVISARLDTLIRLYTPPSMGNLVEHMN